jgi:hypothetical protein
MRGSLNLVEPTSGIGWRGIEPVVHRIVLHQAIDPSSAQVRTGEIHSLQEEKSPEKIRFFLSRKKIQVQRQTVFPFYF